MRLASAVRIYAGTEALPEVALRIDITPHDLPRSLARARDAADEVMASWNLLQIPGENPRVPAAFRTQG